MKNKKGPEPRFTEPVQVQLPPVMRDRLDEIASERMLPRAAVLRAALAHYFAHLDRERVAALETLVS